MIDCGPDLAQQYLSWLRDYLAGGGEAALQGAYELGRRAINAGLGTLEMLAIHQRCLLTAMRETGSPRESVDVADRAANFFAESLSPFEMALRGFGEANAQLSSNLEDLRAAEDSLLHQHSELLAAHQALEAERRRYRDLFDFAPDGYLVTDLRSRIEEANRAAEALLGADCGSLTEVPLRQFVAENMQTAFVDWLEKLPDADAGKAQDWQLDIRSPAGLTFPATLSVRVVRNQQGLPTGLRWLVRDATEGKRIEEERAQLLVREQVALAQAAAAQRFAFLAEISSLLASSLDCESTLAAVARRIVPYLADWCFIYVVEPDLAIRFLCAAHQDAGKTESANALRSEPVCVDAGSRIARVFHEGRPELISEAPESRKGEAAPFQFLWNQGVQSLLLVPIVTHGQALGLVVLGAASPHNYQDDHLVLVDDLARRCALALENAQLYSAMTAERDKAADANRAKDEFLGILSHELRNPLVPVLGWARKLKKNPAVVNDSVLNAGVETLERNALNILRLANDCLDLVRISKSKVTLEKQVLDLNKTAIGSIDALRQTASEKGLRLETRLWPSTVTVLGDRTRLNQVMNNLLLNAIKYTDAGGSITIRSSANVREAEIEIKDTGIGIAPEYLEQIFQPFRRGSKEWLASDGGLGLGLAIARRIVEMHGGGIWAESAGVGRGSTFRVRLPLASPRFSAPDSNDTLSAGQVPVPSLRILLIDDQKDVAELTSMELQSLGHTVLTATDGQLGLETAIREVPDVIISDLKMPRMDGYELIQSLRGVSRLASVPVIALTGFGMKKDIEAALAAGYDACLNKPVEASELSAVIQKLAAQRVMMISKH